MKGIVSLHGTLANPTPADARNIKGNVLVLHGADDPVTSPKQIEDFKEEMKNAGVDMTYVTYSQTRHSLHNTVRRQRQHQGLRLQRTLGEARLDRDG